MVGYDFEFPESIKLSVKLYFVSNRQLIAVFDLILHQYWSMANFIRHIGTNSLGVY